MPAGASTMGSPFWTLTSGGGLEILFLEPDVHDEGRSSGTTKVGTHRH
jgi:hypothetical protein